MLLSVDGKRRAPLRARPGQAAEQKAMPVGEGWQKHSEEVLVLPQAVPLVSAGWQELRRRTAGRSREQRSDSKERLFGAAIPKYS